MSLQWRHWGAQFMKRMIVVTRGLESGTAPAIPSLTIVHLHNVQMLAEGGNID